MGDIFSHLIENPIFNYSIVTWICQEKQSLFSKYRYPYFPSYLRSKTLLLCNVSMISKQNPQSICIQNFVLYSHFCQALYSTNYTYADFSMYLYFEYNINRFTFLPNNRYNMKKYIFSPILFLFNVFQWIFTLLKKISY